MNKEFDSKNIRKLAKEQLVQGKSKQEIYEELVKEFKFRNKIADIVRYTPTVERSKKYSIWNALYLIYISIITLLSLLQPSLGIIWLVLLIVIVALKKFKYYYWNTILGTIAIIAFVALALYQVAHNEAGTTLSFLILPIALVFIIAGIYLPKIMTPKYKERKEKYIDKNGNERLRIVHIFEE